MGFDGLPELTLEVGEFGVDFTGAAVLTCGGSLNCGPFPPISGDNVVYDDFGSGGVITATFDTVVTGRVTRVSAHVTGNTNIVMTAFDEQGVVLDVDQTGGPNFVGSDSGIPANKLLVVESEEGLINRVMFSDSGNTFTLDNFAFVGSPRKVVIDPGHGKIGGSFQRPASSNLGIIEDQLTLSMSNSLTALLKNESINAIPTRSGEDAPFAPSNCGVPCGIDLRKRVRLVEMHEPDVFVSIHTNAASSPTANGTETYYRPNAPSDTDKSSSLAAKINGSLASVGLRDRGVKTSNYAVLNSRFVSALTEVAFHTNIQLAVAQTITDETRLSRPEFRETAAMLIGFGIIEYFEELEESP